jgi:nucleotide-binding universal stress UspA family protein
MVHLELGSSNEKILQFTGELAELFRADVIGIAACQSMQVDINNRYVSSNFIEQVRSQVQESIGAAEAEFRAALGTCVANLDWRSTSTLGSLSQYVAAEARAADILITGVPSGDLLSPSRYVDLNDLVMKVGRPVFIVPSAERKLDLSQVLVAWKDTREARRAVSDALPLLLRADKVTIVEIVDETQLTASRMRLEDVCIWLSRHGVVADSRVVLLSKDETEKLAEVADELRAGVIVGGAFGHSRAREWALGGVTRDLLLRGKRCSVVSH